MPSVGVRELKTNATRILKEVREKKAEYVITYQGKPVGVLLPVDQEELEDYILANHPHFVRKWKKAIRDIEKGKFVGEKELRALK